MQHNMYHNIMIPILVLGDSHSKVFEYCNGKQDRFRFDVFVVDGATAQGAVNPNSQTNALRIFRQKLKSTNCAQYKYVIVNLGEVDCGFVIWYRKDKYNISIEEQLEISAGNLMRFVLSDISLYFSAGNIILNGSVLPTIRDNTDKKYLCGARSKVTASQKERTSLTLRYNDVLKEKSSALGFHYMDITQYIIDKQTQQIQDKYANKDEHDHHLDNEQTYGLWLRELRNIVGV